MRKTHSPDRELDSTSTDVTPPTKRAPGIVARTLAIAAALSTAVPQFAEAAPAPTVPTLPSTTDRPADAPSTFTVVGCIVQDSAGNATLNCAENPLPAWFSRKGSRTTLMSELNSGRATWHMVTQGAHQFLVVEGTTVDGKRYSYVSDQPVRIGYDFSLGLSWNNRRAAAGAPATKGVAAKTGAAGVAGGAASSTGATGGATIETPDAGEELELDTIGTFSAEIGGQIENGVLTLFADGSTIADRAFGGTDGSFDLDLSTALSKSPTLVAALNKKATVKGSINGRESTPDSMEITVHFEIVSDAGALEGVEAKEVLGESGMSSGLYDGRFEFERTIDPKARTTTLTNGTGHKPRTETVAIRGPSVIPVGKIRLKLVGNVNAGKFTRTSSLRAEGDMKITTPRTGGRTVLEELRRLAAPLKQSP